MKLYDTLFRRKALETEDKAVGLAVKDALRRHSDAAKNLEATIKDLLDENVRLRLAGLDPK